MAHPSIKARIQKLGKTYEAQQNRTRLLEKEVVAFFGRSQGLLKRLIDQNDQLLANIKKSKLPEDIFMDDAKRSDQIAQLTVSYQPKFLTLVESKPLLDAIFNFEQRLTKDLRLLEIFSTMKQESEQVLGQLEEEHRKIQPLLETIEQRFSDCKRHLAEIDRFSQHPLN
ncbi:MAG: hypothetical protein K9G41_08525 [Flavobacteriales bacterium]|nr:hypothetical protein [Flavobacteriales bacterium]